VAARWWWVCEATPGSRPSALDQQPEEVPMAPPKGDEPLSFNTHVKPLFRQSDQRSMRFAFDLWRHEDVSQHADAILRRDDANESIPRHVLGMSPQGRRGREAGVQV